MQISLSVYLLVLTQHLTYIETKHHHDSISTSFKGSNKESNVNIKPYKRACRNIGGQCVSRRKPCPNHLPVEELPGAPYCSRRRRCCHPDLPRDCSEIFVRGETNPGVYRIYPDGSSASAVRVWCKEWWTAVLRRVPLHDGDEHIDFNLTWSDYTGYFGQPNKEYWIGLDALHTLTSTKQYVLSLNLQSFDNSITTYYASYDKFVVGPVDNNYTLTISGFNFTGLSTADDAMSYHNNTQFHTYDHDGTVNDCAKLSGGGWWYKNCFRAHLTGVYEDRTNMPHPENLNSITWLESPFFLKNPRKVCSLQEAIMWIIPLSHYS